MKARIAVLAGDGIGPEKSPPRPCGCSRPSRRAVRPREFDDAARAVRRRGHRRTATACRPPRSKPAARPMACCSARSAVRSGRPAAPVRPEQALLRLRAELGVYANLRPITVHPALRDASVIKPEILEGVDLVFVRELTGGIYFGRKSREGDRATDECAYTVGGSRAHHARGWPTGAHASASHRADRQVERARDVAPVARSQRAGDPRGVPGLSRSSTCSSMPPRCT